MPVIAHEAWIVELLSNLDVDPNNGPRSMTHNATVPAQAPTPTHMQAVAPGPWPYSRPHHVLTWDQFVAGETRLGFVYKPYTPPSTDAMPPPPPPAESRSPTPDPDAVDLLYNVNARHGLSNWRGRVPYASPTTIIVGASHTRPGAPQRVSNAQRVQCAKKNLTSLGEQGQQRTLRSTIAKDRMYKALHNDQTRRGWF